ncbi:MAG: hypothetical protein ABSG34_08810 [Candidatus Sulfotelmatobacter sp.]
MGPGILAITRPNCSGDCRITWYSAMQQVTQSVASTQSVTRITLTDVEFAFMRFEIEPNEKLGDYWIGKRLGQ